MLRKYFARHPSVWKGSLTCLIIFLCLATVHSFRAAETPPWKIQKTAESELAPKLETTPKQASVGPTESFSFISYNVKNWLVSYQAKEKSKVSKAAVIALLALGKPDIIGLSEIGSEDDIKEIQTALEAEGIQLPFIYHTGGADKVRHLGMLSKFPIHQSTEPSLEIPGQPYHIQRGILDVEIKIGEGIVRFIGIHLKSKRLIPEFDQAEMRRNEAKVVRKHLDSIFKKQADAKLIVYGDFNDTTRSPSTRTIFGRYNARNSLRPIDLKDERGENWTHNWNHQDIYSRIDFIAVSRSLSPKIDRKISRIIDQPYWEDASDHRALLLKTK